MSNVTVTAQFGGGSQPAAHGRYTFAAQGTLMDSSDVAIVTPVVIGVLDSTGLLSVELLPSDTDGFAEGALNWHVFVDVQGMPTVDVANVDVNSELGDSQNLFDILTAAGWTPTST